MERRKKQKPIARKSTGGYAPRRPLPVRVRGVNVTARKSTGGYAPLRGASFRRHNYVDDHRDDASTTVSDDSDGDDDTDERPTPSGERQPPRPPKRQRRSRSSNYPRPPLPYAMGSSSSVSANLPSTDVAGTSSSSTSTRQEPSLVVRLPVTQECVGLNRRGAESPRSMVQSQVVTSAVNAAVAALKSSSSSPARSPQAQYADASGLDVGLEVGPSDIRVVRIQGSYQDQQVAPPPRQPSPQDNSCDTTTVDSTSPLAPPPTGSSSPPDEGSKPIASASGSNTMGPPPAIPGHSRWLFPQGGASTASSQTDLPVTRGKKHFPIPLNQESTLKKSKASETITSQSTKRNELGSDIDKHRTKKAFKSFQSIRKLLTDTGMCSTIEGYGHLNAVEQMLLKCYNSAKKKSHGGAGGTVIDLTTDEPQRPEAEAEQQEVEEVEVVVTPVGVPTNLSTVFCSLARSSQPEVPHEIDIGDDEPEPTAGNRQRVVVRTASEGVPLAGTSSTTQYTTTRPSRDVVDDIIDAVARGVTAADGRDNLLLRPAATTTTTAGDADIAAQLRPDHRDTFVRLTNMGFGGGEAAAFAWLKQLVEESNGILEICLDKLTK